MIMIVHADYSSMLQLSMAAPAGLLNWICSGEELKRLPVEAQVTKVSMTSSDCFLMRALAAVEP